MFEEAWMADARRQKRWDAWQARRPKCTTCGLPIVDEQYLPTEDGPVCPGCIKYRMVAVEPE